MPKCPICNSNTNCLSCLTNFNLIKNPDPTSDECECDPASVRSSNCLKCSSPNVCSQCKDGFFLDSNN